MVSHGRGSQKFLTQDYTDDRCKAMEDRNKYDDDTLEELELDTNKAKGGGETDPDNYKFRTFPYPADKTRKKVYVQDVDPRVGD